MEISNSPNGWQEHIKLLLSKPWPKNIKESKEVWRKKIGGGRR